MLWAVRPVVLSQVAANDLSGLIADLLSDLSYSSSRSWGWGWGGPYLLSGEAADFVTDLVL